MAMYLVCCYIVIYWFLSDPEIREEFDLFTILFCALTFLFFRYIIGWLKTFPPSWLILPVLYSILLLLVRGYLYFLPITALYESPRYNESSSNRLITFGTYSMPCRRTLGQKLYLGATPKTLPKIVCNEEVYTRINEIAIHYGWTDKAEDMEFSFDTQYFLFKETALMYGYNRLALLSMSTLTKFRYFLTFLLEHFIYAILFATIAVLLQRRNLALK